MTVPIDDESATLPDLLTDGLDLVFVGINPSVFSAEAGHYFARRANRFWPCFSASILSLAARQALGVAVLEPAHDRLLPAQGIGFTDLVKRPTPKAIDLTPRELAAGVAALHAKLERYRPRLACFQGMTAYRPVHRALTGSTDDPILGLQKIRIGATLLAVVPNPSGANAHFTRAQQTGWYDRLSAYLGGAEG
jgi:TDG/mug DNA glycosylase family protein